MVDKLPQYGFKVVQKWLQLLHVWSTNGILWSDHNRNNYLNMKRNEGFSSQIQFGDVRSLYSTDTTSFYHSIPLHKLLLPIYPLAPCPLPNLSLPIPPPHSQEKINRKARKKSSLTLCTNTFFCNSFLDFSPFRRIHPLPSSESLFFMHV